jgi:hypothetical protein
MLNQHAAMRSGDDDAFCSARVLALDAAHVNCEFPAGVTVT